ncbi:MAG TPA: hypothetical protein VIA62_26970 [Thermoanaerobaculia bacterium]|nr:hypothetical protein [Thermoanaerobaculia bacterium]
MEWPRCHLLLELALQYSATGRTHGCDKLMARIEEGRARLDGAPDLVLSFLNELSYAIWLLSRNERGEARHHVTQARRKATQIEVLLQRLRCSAARERGHRLCRRSAELQARVPELLRRSAQLLSRSLAVRGPIRPTEAHPAG